MDDDQLYGLALERFVPERDALAKSLRAGGQREEAARVAKLRKPSVAAWAVNQLVRTQGRDVSALFEAGDELVQAHGAVVAGTGDGRSLRAAAERQRAAVDALLGAARGLLSTQGHELSPAIIERVADTLQAAALDDGARDQVRHGRLERELRHVGLGALGAAGGLPAAPAPRKSENPRQADAEARRQAEQAEAEARRRAERAERSLREAARARDRAREQLTSAEEALAAAEQAAGRAEAEARAATEAHREARERLDRLARA